MSPEPGRRRACACFSKGSERRGQCSSSGSARQARRHARCKGRQRRREREGSRLLPVPSAVAASSVAAAAAAIATAAATVRVVPAQRKARRERQVSRACGKHSTAIRNGGLRSRRRELAPRCAMRPEEACLLGSKPVRPARQKEQGQGVPGPHAASRPVLRRSAAPAGGGNFCSRCPRALRGSPAPMRPQLRSSMRRRRAKSGQAGGKASAAAPESPCRPDGPLPGVLGRLHSLPGPWPGCRRLAVRMELAVWGWPASCTQGKPQLACCHRHHHRRSHRRHSRRSRRSEGESGSGRGSSFFRGLVHPG